MAIEDYKNGEEDDAERIKELEDEIKSLMTERETAIRDEVNAAKEEWEAE